MINNTFSSSLIKQHRHNRARIMKMITPHGEVITPCFMPVGTQALVNYLNPSDLLAAGSQIILGGNTYHMLIKPGLHTLSVVGGMHKFMGWQKAMLTDSGGFQVLSLAKKSGLCKIDDSGAHFKHPLTGQITHLTPDTSINAQKVIGADIIMAFDECTPATSDRGLALAALERTHRWFSQSQEIHDNNPYSLYGKRQALFGIIQGGNFADLREKSAEFIIAANPDGIAIGGEVIGFNMPETVSILQWLCPLLPSNKIRYTMGVGLKPQDLIDVVCQGVDIFDCVAPTRNARHGSLYYGRLQFNNDQPYFASDSSTNHILIKKSIYAQDDQPIYYDCHCYTCRNFTRSYLHYLYKEGKFAYQHLACIHNIHTMQQVCLGLQQWIAAS